MPPSDAEPHGNQKSTHWEPAKFVPSSQAEAYGPWAVCILNQPLENREHLLRVCERAAVVVCADAGANRVKDLHLTQAEESRCHIAAICGDFDSVSPAVLQYYQDKGAILKHDPDQYATDLAKSLKFISTWTEKHRDAPTLDVVLFAGLGGRADQAFSLLHYLYMYSSDKTFPGIRDVHLITKESILFVLRRGHNVITAPVGQAGFTKDVGIIPLGKPAVITTKGLEWDVSEWKTEFGGQISTSNHIVAERVEVWTSERVVFTLSFTGEV